MTRITLPLCTIGYTAHMPTNAILRTFLGLLAAFLVAFGGLGILVGLVAMAGFGGCADEVCTADLRTFDERARDTLAAAIAFLLGAGACIYLARTS